MGGGTPLSSNGSQCKTAPIVKDGKLYMTHSIGNSTYSFYASIKYVVVDLNTITIEEQAEFGGVGHYYIYPTIAVDADNNIAVTFTRSDSTSYAGAYYSTKKAGDPPGLSPSSSFALGRGNYVRLDGSTPPRNRWGDYMAIYLDPADNHGFLHAY